MVGSPRRCVLLFARTAQAEAAAKGLRGAESLFSRSVARICAAVEARPDVDLIVVGAVAFRAAKVVLPQRGCTLAGRLTAAFEDVFALGYTQIVAVGLDSPGLTAEHIESAWEALECGHPVLGPCADGGVYLVGLTRADAPALPGIPWGTGRVTRALRGVLPEAVLLGRLQDLDRPGDLRGAARAAPQDFLLSAVAARLAGLVSAPRGTDLPVVQAHRLPDSRAPPRA